MKHWLFAIALVCFGSTAKGASLDISGGAASSSINGTAVSPATVTITGLTANKIVTTGASGVLVTYSTMSLTGAGNVGINTASPSATLDVTGNLVIGNTVARSTIAATGNAQFGNNMTIKGNPAVLTLDSANGGSEIITATDDTVLYLETNNASGQIKLYSGSDVLAVTIDSGQNVIISTLTISKTQPPDSQALCIKTGTLGHCTSVVGVGGGCTCVAP